MWKSKQTAVALATAILLAACGGGDSGAPKAQATLAGVTTQQLAASAYVDVVQKLYIAYFGRPADAGGLANFTAQLSAVGAPTGIKDLEQAYYNNTDVRSLVDGFSTSAESTALYPGDTTAFVTAVYDHLLNRAPDAEGLKYWVNAIDNGGLSKSLASLSIAAGALSNTTDQGKKDAALIGIKSTVANSFTTALENAQGAYVGDDQAALARTMLAGLSATSTLASFQPVLDAVTADMKAGNQSTKPYPLLLSYISFLSRGQTQQTSTITGYCSGYAISTVSAPAAAIFEGKSVLALTGDHTTTYSSCNPGTSSARGQQYFDANYNLLGTQSEGSEYAVMVNTPAPLPVRVAVGDSGAYGTSTVYADSTKKTVYGRRELSYAIEADTVALKPASAVLVLKEMSYTTDNVLAYKVQTRYRIAVDGSVTPLSETQDYAANSIQLVLKAQPSALKITDSVTGTGTLAVAGKTLTVHYTGWLYDATAANFRGTEIDTSAYRGPLSFVLGSGKLIAGWEQGFGGMKVGGKRTLIIPPALGYGYANSGSIGAGYGLVFDVELISVN
jgi:FKBP-type peptidyl-prolyl cis-trans isomerase